MTTIRYDDAGLVPGIVVHADTGEVLMLAYLNDEAVAATRSSGFVHFWSRSRRKLWKKGETSGHVLELVAIEVDCDADTLRISARPTGPVCHTGARTCFDRPDSPTPAPVGFSRLESLWATIRNRAEERPASSYTTALLDGGPQATGRKVLEEAAEVVDAALRHALGHVGSTRVDEEAADLVYHLLVALAEREVGPEGFLGILAARRR